jgi:hypothetical protein
MDEEYEEYDYTFLDDMLEENQKQINETEINLLIEENKKIIDLINNDCINEDLKNKIKIYISNLKRTKDITVRNQNNSIFSVIYTYCIMNQIDFDPNYLKNELGLKTKDITTILRVISHVYKDKKNINKIPIFIMSYENFYPSLIAEEKITKEDLPKLKFISEKFKKCVHMRKLEMLENINPIILLAWIILNLLKKNLSSKSKTSNYFTQINQNKINKILFGYKFEDETLFDIDKFSKEVEEEYKE